MQNLEVLTADAARATSLTVAQMERADQLFGDVTIGSIQLLSFLPSVIGPAGKGVAFMGGLKAVFGAIREIRQVSPISQEAPRPRAHGDDRPFTG